MVAIQEQVRLQDQEVVFLISYLLALRGHARPLHEIYDELANGSTTTDLAIYTICDTKALGDSTMKEAREQRLQRRYHDLLIGRPPIFRLLDTQRFKQVVGSSFEPTWTDSRNAIVCNVE